MFYRHFYRSGFTLIELMVTVSVVAILATIASASYNNVMAKGDRSTAISDTLEIAQGLERYFSFNRTYTNNFAELSMAINAAYSINDTQGLYTYYIGIPGTTAVNAVPQGSRNGLSYTIYAKPTSKNRDDWIMALNELGFKTHYASGSTTGLDGWP